MLPIHGGRCFAPIIVGKILWEMLCSRLVEDASLPLPSKEPLSPSASWVIVVASRWVGAASVVANCWVGAASVVLVCASVCSSVLPPLRLSRH